jgi:hypothetical protein
MEIVVPLAVPGLKLPSAGPSYQNTDEGQQM